MRAPCPTSGKLGKRKGTCNREVRTVAFKFVAYLRITYGEYAAQCKCCTTFRIAPEGVLPKAHYDNKVRDLVLDRFLNEGMNIDLVLESLRREFLLELSTEFVYEVLRGRAEQLDMAGHRRKVLLLRAGAPEIIVPDAVLREVGGRGAADPVFQEILWAVWLKIVPTLPTPPQVRVWNFGAGESAVLALALNDRDCEAVLDDRDARRCAQTLKIGVRGTLGLVVLAKQIGSIPSARPVVEQLRRSGLYLTDDVTN